MNKPTDNKNAATKALPSSYGSVPLPKVSINVPKPKCKPPRKEESDVPEWVAKEIRDTWNTARVSGGQTQSFRIFERMTDRLGWGRKNDNPSLAENFTE